MAGRAAMVSHYTRTADQERLARRAMDYRMPITMGDRDED